MKQIALTFTGEIYFEFMIQLPKENSVYRIMTDGEYTSVFRGDNEVYSYNTSNLLKALKSYLVRRFGYGNFQVSDYTKGV